MNRTLIIFAAILTLMSVPRGLTERSRGVVVSVLAPSWEQLGYLKLLIGSPFSKLKGKERSVLTPNDEIRRLQLENQLLLAEIERMQEVMEHELFLNAKLEDFREKKRTTPELELSVTPHHQMLKNLLSIQLKACPARVIFRSPSSWNSTLWLNVGSEGNEGVIAKNSPVMVGRSVIGVIDYVGKRQSRVRLITDSGLTPSVRAFREGKYLAKGELSGSGLPMWRKAGQVLHGTGFNYDFADDEGPSRDLRTGQPLEKSKEKALPILQACDLLVTTGMDGVFPAGLQVAEVTSVAPLKEGDFCYEIEATPTAGSLDDLTMVLVIPPLGYEP